ncbi:hypothetical protein HG531_000515 [Fusarium graminearum]|nr:hypothetical protein HG531_000515 [Fusarium graminearum]
MLHTTLNSVTVSLAGGKIVLYQSSVDVTRNKRDEYHSRQLVSLFSLKKFPHSLAGDLGGRIIWEPIDSCADGTECNSLDAILHGQLETLAVAHGELLVRMSFTTEDWTDCVDDMLGRKFVSLGDDSITGVDGAESSRLLDQVRSCSAVNGAVDTAAAAEGLVGSVDDGVDTEFGDVSSDQTDASVDGIIRRVGSFARWNTRGENRIWISVELSEAGNIADASDAHCDESPREHESRRRAVVECDDEQLKRIVSWLALMKEKEE